jgi:hypothetical protein
MVSLHIGSDRHNGFCCFALAQAAQQCQSIAFGDGHQVLQQCLQLVTLLLQCLIPALLCYDGCCIGLGDIMTVMIVSSTR